MARRGQLLRWPWPVDRRLLRCSLHFPFFFTPPHTTTPTDPSTPANVPASACSPCRLRWPLFWVGVIAKFLGPSSSLALTPALPPPACAYHPLHDHPLDTEASPSRRPITMETQAVDWCIAEADEEQQGQQQEGAAPVVAGELKVLLHPEMGGAPTTVVRRLHMGENRVGECWCLVALREWADGSNGWAGGSIDRLIDRRGLC